MTNNDFHNILDMLVDFQVNADLVEFQQIFGLNMGIHFWDKFRNYNHQIIPLWGVMDKTYRKALVNYLYMNKRKDYK